MIDNCYKDTGTDWLPAIPKEWQSIRFTKVYQFFKGLDIKKRDLEADGIPVLSYGQIHSKLNLAVKIIPELIRFIPENRLPVVPSERALLQAGDIVFADTSEDIAGVGNLCRVSEEDRIFAGYHTLVARPRNQYCHKYYAYLFNSEIWRQQIRQAVQGVKVFSITQSIFHSVSIIEPTPTDQDRIVAFLDSKTGEIDGLVGQLTEQRGLLERYKRELIAHTVTHGLDPDAEMKDSGIDWIGQIPAHWETARFSAGYMLRRGADIKKKDLEEDGIPVISYGQIHAKDNPYTRLLNSHVRFVPKRFMVREIVEGKKLKEGDIVFADTSEDIMGIGNLVRISKDDCVYAGYHTLVATPISEYQSKYFAYLLSSMAWRSQLRAETQGVKVFSLTHRILKKTMLIIPSVSEQVQISDFLDTKSGEIDGLISDIDREIELLQKYRKQMINDVVTGKVRVTEQVGEEA